MACSDSATAADEVNEGNSGVIQASLLDKNGAPALPLTLSYRIDCLSNGVQVLGWTAVTPSASPEIPLTSQDTAIINRLNAKERKRITIFATYGAGGVDNAASEYDFTVNRLQFINPGP